MTGDWKKLNLYGEKDCSTSAEDMAGAKEELRLSSAYLLAQNAQTEECQRDLLYDVLGPVFFGKKEAESQEELAALFRARYGIDVRHDFYEGDEHYEEYREAQQAIAEGMSIYGGRIVFEDCVLADLAEQVWEAMEKQNGTKFRRINTALEE